MNPTEFAYGAKVTIDASLDEAHDRVAAALKSEGFGILTEIDIAAALKEKLGVDFRPYRILGACNPPIAHQALEADVDIGLLLPCNLVIYQADDQTQTVVAAIDPAVQLSITGRADVAPLASEVRERLERVLRAL